MNGILLKTTCYPNNIAIHVDNFSKENVIDAISKFTGINIKDIEQITACTSYGLYCFKSTLIYCGFLQELKDYNPDKIFTFQVDYISILL